MAAQQFKGRGVVTLGGNDVGNASGLTIFTDVEEIPRKAFSAPYTEGGETHIAQRVGSVIIEIVLTDWYAANLEDAMRASANSALEGVPATQALSMAGFNTADDCGAITLTVPRFWAIPTEEIPLIAEGLSNLIIRGRAIYQSGASPEWYSLTVAT